MDLRIMSVMLIFNGGVLLASDGGAMVARW